MEILIIDDDIECLNSIEFALMPSKYFCYKTSSPKEAMELLNIKKIDVVIIDINMPEINGMELMECIKEKKTDIKIIIITGYPDLENTIKACNNKVYGFFIKPIEFIQLINKLREIEFETIDIKILDKLKNENKYLIEEYEDIIFNLKTNAKNTFNKKVITSYEKLCKLLYLESYDYFKEKLKESINKIFNIQELQDKV